MANNAGADRPTDGRKRRGEKVEKREGPGGKTKHSPQQISFEVSGRKFTQDRIGSAFLLIIIVLCVIL